MVGSYLTLTKNVPCLQLGAAVPQTVAPSFSRRGEALIGQKMFAVLELARRFEDEGHKVFHLELGNPRSVPPPNLIARTIESLAGHDVGYTYSAGHPLLRQSIAQMYDGAGGRRVTEQNVVISPANFIINQFLDLVCDPGDRVVYFTPAFPTYWAAAAHIGLEVRSVPLSPLGGFELTDETVDIAVAHAPRAIIVNSANNPTGAVYNAEVLSRLAEECDKRGIWLLSDETYAEISYGRVFSSLAGKEHPRLAVMSSFSKIFSIPGYRVGFVLADPALAEKFSLSISTQLSCLPVFTQLGCVAGLAELRDYTRQVREKVVEITDWCTAELFRCNRLAFQRPQAGFYFFVDIRATGMDDTEFSRRLLEEKHTAVTPGSSFGASYGGFVRVATCGDAGDVREGISRLISFAGNG